MRGPRRIATWLLGCLLLLSAAGCQGTDDLDLTQYEGTHPTASPSATRGVAGLTRPFTTLDELLGVVDEWEGCPKPKRVDTATISFYLEEGMANIIAEAAICSDGQGAVIGILKPQQMPVFQRTYQRAVRVNPMLWNDSTHQVMLGNGFFVFPLGAPSGWSLAGLEFLRCDSGQATIPDYQKGIPADIPGCSLAGEPWGGR